MPCPQPWARPRGRPKPFRKPYRPGVAGSGNDSVAIGPRIADLLARMGAGEVPASGQVRDAVRALLARLRERAPGRSVEVRVPPFGAAQCVAGPRHTRGTPPNVVETDPETFLRLAAGEVSFADAVAAGRVRASGVRADLTPYLPLVDTGSAPYPPATTG